MTDLHRWLSENSMTDYEFSSTTNTIKIHASVRSLEALFKTEIHEYFHHTIKRILRASKRLEMPSHLLDHVSYVNLNLHPIGRSLKGRSHRYSNSGDPIQDTRSGGGCTPDFLRTWYGIPRQENANETNAQGIPEFYEEAWSESDLIKFFDTYMAGEALPSLVTHQVPDRDNSYKKASGEASLDLQYITALTPRTTTYVWSQTGTNPYSSIDEPFVEWAEDIVKMSRPAYVVSISYSDDEQHIFESSEAYARSFDVLLMKLAARGVSVLVASGDDGVAGQRPGLQKIDKSDTTAWCQVHGPQWPTSSPYLTSVGATMLAKSEDAPSYFNTLDEVICSTERGSTITSGGGFSNKYDRPSYQDQAVKQFLTTRNLPPSNFFNASGRAYPDVSMIGNSFRIFVKGATTLISGTSASTPVFASVLTLVNDKRLNAGKPPLGFVNPALYKIYEKYPQAFHDITVGTNAAGMGPGRPVCTHSFHAESGWDAASGIGSPNFAVLSQLLFNVEEILSGSNESISAEIQPANKPNGPTKALFAASIACLVASLLFAIASVCYIRRHSNKKPYRELDPDKADTPIYPTPEKDTNAIFTIDGDDQGVH
ncbi:unnamed protein product [Aphanomyces euteiches]